MTKAYVEKYSNITCYTITQNSDIPRNARYIKVFIKATIALFLLWERNVISLNSSNHVLFILGQLCVFFTCNGPRLQHPGQSKS